MSDESQAPKPDEPTQSYRTCDACGCQVHQSRDCCPECGAFPHEYHPPIADSKFNLILSSVLILILALALLALSRNSEEAAIAENKMFARLEIDSTSEGPSQGIPVMPLHSPTPKPKPTPATPTPTSIPFNPEDFGAPPVEPSKPRPTKIPTPPTPIPEPTRPSTLDLKDQLMDEFRADLDERFPMAKEGEFVRLTLRDNRTVGGTILRMEPNQLSLQTSSGQRWVVYRQLSRESRMRVDNGERETWVEEQALEEVLKRIQN